MVFWWIVGILILLLVLLARVRVGVQLSFGEELRVAATVAGVKITLLPKKEKVKKKEEKPVKKADKAPKPAKEKPKKEWVKPTFADIRKAFPVLFDALKRALSKTRRRLRIDPMHLAVLIGGDDPVAVTQAYGWANSVLWTVMPQLEQLVQIPAPHIHLEPDFQRSASCAEGKLGMSFRVGDLVNIALTAAIPVLRWFLALQKKTKDTTPTA